MLKSGSSLTITKCFWLDMSVLSWLHAFILNHPNIGRERLCVLAVASWCSQFQTRGVTAHGASTTQHALPFNHSHFTLFHTCLFISSLFHYDYTYLQTFFFFDVRRTITVTILFFAPVILIKRNTRRYVCLEEPLLMALVFLKQDGPDWFTPPVNLTSAAHYGLCGVATRRGVLPRGVQSHRPLVAHV